MYCGSIKQVPGLVTCLGAICLVYTMTLLFYYASYERRTPSEVVAAYGDVMNSTEDYLDHVVVEPDVSMATNGTLLVFVQSASMNLHKRAIIRQTWGNRSLYRKESADGRNVVVIFAVGRDYIGKPDKWSAIQTEIRQHRDVLLLNMRDEYNMLSLKGLYTMKWIRRRLPQVGYVMKTDDDVLLNIPVWLRIARRLADGRWPCCIVCFAWINPALQRANPRHAVSIQEYRHANYPSFCSGLGYLLTAGALRAVLEASDLLALFVRDDPYFTGMLGYVAAVRLVTVPRQSVIIYGDPDEVAGALQRPVLAVHGSPMPFWTVLWEQIMLDYRSGGKQRPLALRSLAPRDRILPYLRPAFDLGYNTTLRRTCAASAPEPGTVVRIYV